MRERATSAVAVEQRHAEPSLSKYSSDTDEKRVDGLQISGRRSNTARALSLKIARVLSPVSASVNPEKLRHTMEKQSWIAVM